MELGIKEQIITLAALSEYMKALKKKMESDSLDEDEFSDIVNDATLVEILISRLEAELKL